MKEQKTPLYEMHVKYQGKIVPFAGWLLPVQYHTGIVAEHQAVRTKAGLFDVSHMGEITLSGKDALANLQHMLTNDFTAMADGQARYSPMCNEKGGVVDDLIVYKVQENSYFIVVNAANKDKDVAWIQSHLFGEAAAMDISNQTAQIALQGPRAVDILQKAAAEQYIPKNYYMAVFHGEIQGHPCVISRTGYTGEDGFEIYTAPEDAPTIWELLLELGRDEGLIPCGLGARDTLRLEAAMPLYGHEMNDEITPLEAGLSFAVKMKKQSFIGKKALLEKGTPSLIRVGLQVNGRGIVREQAALFLNGRRVGITTSGTHCPFCNQALAMALVDRETAAIGNVLEAEVRGRKIPCEIVPLPFYKRP